MLNCRQFGLPDVTANTTLSYMHCSKLILEQQALQPLDAEHFYNLCMLCSIGGAMFNDSDFLCHGILRHVLLPEQPNSAQQQLQGLYC